MYTLQKLAEHVGGRVAGDSQIEIRGIQPFESAGPGDLTLAAQKKYQEHLDQTGASAVIVSPAVVSDQKPLLQVEKPKVAFARLLALFHPAPSANQGISPLADISESAQISEDVTIYPFVSVGDHCVIGRGCVLHPQVTLYANVSLGERVILHSGTVIGADGFGYVFDGQTQVKIPQTGSVTIGDDVEIGANSCVDRATFGATVLERGVKLDNHVHIGHNCRIGENTVIAGQVGLSGSVEVGKNCIFAGHAGVVDHVKIGDHVTVMMKSAVSKDVPSRSVVSGQPAMDHRQWMKIEAVTRRFPEIYREWKSWLKENRK
jgi:UDP-3-O-[3-hydroxymyristoyl] glucosamine N-acyltransferase